MCMTIRASMGVCVCGCSMRGFVCMFELKLCVHSSDCVCVGVWVYVWVCMGMCVDVEMRTTMSLSVGMSVCVCVGMFGIGV